MNRQPANSISPSVVFTRIRVVDYWKLTKPRLVFLVLLSTIAGYFLGSGDSRDATRFFSMLAGTALAAAGSMILNQWMEREEDSRMSRTAKRPIPEGRIEPVEALVFGVLLSIAGLMILKLLVQTESALLAALTLASYLFVYTPLKRKTSLCTLAGAFPGAIPPLIGWSAAGAVMTFQAGVLFFILFLWQLPHFLAIAWLYRKDYEAAGFHVLSAGDSGGQKAGRQMLLYSLALLPVTLLPTLAGMTGRLYFSGALFLGIAFAGLAAASLKRLDQKARLLFFASVIHLAVLLALMLADKT